MAIRDTDITDWSTTTADNQPSDATFIGGDLAGQFRNIKSIARSESLSKEWEKTGLVTAQAFDGTPSAIGFAAGDGDVSAMFPAGRKVRLRPSNGSTSYVYAGVIEATHSSATLVSLVDLDGAVSDSGEYFVDVGVEKPGANPWPLYTQSGTATASALGILDFNFPHEERDLNYFIKFTLISSNSANAGATIIAEVSKSDTGVNATCSDVPGGGATVIFGWTLYRVT